MTVGCWCDQQTLDCGVWILSLRNGSGSDSFKPKWRASASWVCGQGLNVILKKNILLSLLLSVTFSSKFCKSQRGKPTSSRICPHLNFSCGFLQKKKKSPLGSCFLQRPLFQAELHKVVECGLVLQDELVQLVSKTRIIYCRTNAIISALDAGCRFSSSIFFFFIGMCSSLRKEDVCSVCDI